MRESVPRVRDAVREIWRVEGIFGESDEEVIDELSSAWCRNGRIGGGGGGGVDPGSAKGFDVV